MFSPVVACFAALENKRRCTQQIPLNLPLDKCSMYKKHTAESLFCFPVIWLDSGLAKSLVYSGSPFCRT